MKFPCFQESVSSSFLLSNWQSRAVGLSGFCDWEKTGPAQVRIGYLQRFVSIAGGLLLIYPGILTDAIGAALVVGVILWRMMQKRRAAA